MPTTDQNGDSKPVRAWPGQEFSCWSAGGTSAPGGAAFAAAVIFSSRPLQPPTRLRPSETSGRSEATMTKNCSTSL